MFHLFLSVFLFLSVPVFGDWCADHNGYENILCLISSDTTLPFLLNPTGSPDQWYSIEFRCSSTTNTNIALTKSIFEHGFQSEYYSFTGYSDSCSFHLSGDLFDNVVAYGYAVITFDFSGTSPGTPSPSLAFPSFGFDLILQGNAFIS